MPVVLRRQFHREPRRFILQDRAVCGRDNTHDGSLVRQAPNSHVGRLAERPVRVLPVHVERRITGQRAFAQKHTLTPTGADDNQGVRAVQPCRQQTAGFRLQDPAQARSRPHRQRQVRGLVDTHHRSIVSQHQEADELDHAIRTDIEPPLRRHTPLSSDHKAPRRRPRAQHPFIRPRVSPGQPLPGDVSILPDMGRQEHGPAHLPVEDDTERVGRVRSEPRERWAHVHH